MFGVPSTIVFHHGIRVRECLNSFAIGIRLYRRRVQTRINGVPISLNHLLELVCHSASRRQSFQSITVLLTYQRWEQRSFEMIRDGLSLSRLRQAEEFWHFKQHRQRCARVYPKFPDSSAVIGNERFQRCVASCFC